MLAVRPTDAIASESAKLTMGRYTKSCLHTPFKSCVKSEVRSQEVLNLVRTLNLKVYFENRI